MHYWGTLFPRYTHNYPLYSIFKGEPARASQHRIGQIRIRSYALELKLKAWPLQGSNLADFFSALGRNMCSADEVELSSIGIVAKVRDSALLMISAALSIRLSVISWLT